MLNVQWKNLKCAGRLAVLIASAGVIPINSYAQEVENSRPYFFSGPCSSQGMWTQQALNLTNQIRDVALQLKNDPNCQATSGALQKMLAETQTQIRNADPSGTGDPQAPGNRLTTLPQEIGALRTFMTAGATGKGVLQSMMRKAVEFSTLTAQQANNSGPQTSTDPKSLLLQGMSVRVLRATSTGLNVFNGVIDTVAKNSQCLTGPQQGQFLSAAAATLASFASSGQEQLGNQLATAVSKIGRLGRELKFSKTFKELNKIEFMSSMSCLMEITSESYCSARDGMDLFLEMNKQMKQDAVEKTNMAKSVKNPASPLAGYYILTQHLPMVANWLQKVQIGVDPKLLTDAQFQIGILNKVNNFFTSVKRLQGLFNEQGSYIRALKDPISKKIKLIEMVNSLNNGLMGSNDLASSEFFTSSVQPIEIPFRLLGIRVPPAFFDANSTLSFEKWIQNDANFATVPNSGNIDALTDAIGQNMDKIIDVARESALIYYNRFYIPDKKSPFLDAMLGTNYTIKDSLIAIDQYLGRLQKKISESYPDKSYLGSIIETRGKIGRILAKFRDVQALGVEMQSAPRVLPLDLMARLHKVHFDFVNEVFEQFDVQLSRSGWLSNRMAKFVYYDYSMMLRQGVDLSPHFKELYYATGFAAYDKMISMANGGPASVEADLKSALIANKNNISALETLFKPNLVGMIATQAQISKQTELAIQECGKLMPSGFKVLARPEQVKIEGKIVACQKKYEITPGSVWWDQHVRSFKEGYESMPGESGNPMVRVPVGIWTSFKGLFLDQITGSSTQEKYELPGATKSIFNANREKTSFDDEVGSSKYIFSKMCVQALAFNDIKTVWSLCKDAVLESNFNLPLETTHFKGMSPDYFKVKFQEKAYEDIQNPALNLSKRICAFRDFYRRNQVLYMTMGMQLEANDTYEGGYTIEEEKIQPVIIQPTPVADEAEEQPLPMSKTQKKAVKRK